MLTMTSLDWISIESFGAHALIPSELVEAHAVRTADIVVLFAFIHI